MTRIVVWVVVALSLLRGLMPGGGARSPAIVVRPSWLTLGFAGAAVALGAVIILVSGVMPITASSGHWAVTEWFLHFAMRRSVATHSLGTQAPPLDDPALVLRGAGHYESGCRPCHGGPGESLPQIPQAMTPHPPELPSRISDWQPRELFYIVKHGVKFTGMPAWPAQQRDDEVWAVVAFLRRLPELGREEYQSLVRGGGTSLAELGPDVPPDVSSSLSADLLSEAGPPPEVVIDNCARCHGVDGNGRGVGAFPKLAGQRAEYMDRALRAYADGRRHSGIMGPIAGALTASARDDVVRFYAAMTAPSPTPMAEPPASSTPATRPAPDAAAAEGRLGMSPGERIATQGLAAQKIPPCAECHGPATAAKNDAYPRLAGQYSRYLILQLELLQERRRGGSEYVHVMHSFVDRLTADQISDVAQYYASLR